ncbi:septum site-determining protein MinC [Gloeocapsopsis dulcis]|uniref:Probable septum site-determining protein MinC n=1 Tax=Gloeocapsopsis dulcis AAB1 = 1H9 TaxID=1433147 RepID=A0A6N8FZN6_9CHRO|nr:septum site-determining protein MinC [Gloeocapsopsis dulcis]MUL38329.1 septum site-determining protein MinC [Gloeocapsopsis dulcis AAB1 = 1H9]WNN91174.1 septum site-determining protein MinC [Gloeocapsopsis dulcis]
MTDSALPEIETTVVPPSNPVNANLQVRLKGEGEKLLLILPTETETATATSWSDLWQQLKQRLNGGDRFWQPNTSVHLMATDRLLDARQLQAIADALSEVQLQLTRVFTSRRQTSVAAATAGYSVEQQAPVTGINQTLNATPVPLAEPLYLQMTVRSGMEIRHAGSVIVLGDLNPGGTVVANGDILVWGRLRGVAHAGAAGNSKCLIMALQMEPTQLRIAEFVARAPTNVPSQFYPEIAYVMSEGIRIAKAADFSKSQFSLPS